MLIMIARMKQNNQRRKHPIYHLAAVGQQQQSMNTSGKDNQKPSRAQVTENNKTKSVQVQAGGPTSNKDVQPFQTEKQPQQGPQPWKQPQVLSLCSANNPYLRVHCNDTNCSICRPQNNHHSFNMTQQNGSMQSQPQDINKRQDVPNPANPGNRKLTKKQQSQLQKQQFQLQMQQLKLQREKNRRYLEQLQRSLGQQIMQKEGYEALLKYRRIRDPRGIIQKIQKNKGEQPPAKQDFSQDDWIKLHNQLLGYGDKVNHLTNRQIHSLWLYHQQQGKVTFYKNEIKNIAPKNWQWSPLNRDNYDENLELKKHRIRERNRVKREKEEAKRRREEEDEN